MDYERSLISAAIREHDLTPLFESGIKPTYFQDDEHKRVFIWMLDYYTRFAMCPTRRALKEEFPTYKIWAVEEPYQYYIELLRHDRKRAILTDLVGENLDKIDTDPEAVIAALANGLTGLYEEVGSLTDDNLTDSWEKRLEEYRSLRDTPGLRGIPTGFPTIDDATGGIQEEQLVTIVGLPKVGKSWIILEMAIAAHQAGYRPLFITFEMSNAEQAARYDAMRAGVNYKHLLEGRMSKEEERLLQESMKELADAHEFVMVHDITAATTVPALVAKAQQYKPDAIYVDGAYLMDSGTTFDQGSPQAITAITRALKRQTQRMHIPTVCTTQGSVYRYASRTGMQLKDILYSSGFAQDSDLLLSAEKPDPKARPVKLSIMAARNARQGVATNLLIDWNTSSVEEMEFDGEAEGDDEDPS